MFNQQQPNLFRPATGNAWQPNQNAQQPQQQAGFGQQPTNTFGQNTGFGQNTAATGQFNKPGMFGSGQSTFGGS